VLSIANCCDYRPMIWPQQHHVLFHKAQSKVRMRPTVDHAITHTYDHVISRFDHTYSNLMRRETNEKNRQSKVKTNLNISATLIQTMLFHSKIFRKCSPKKRTHINKTSPNTATRNCQKFLATQQKTAQLRGKNAQLATLRFIASCNYLAVAFVSYVTVHLVVCFA